MASTAVFPPTRYQGSKRKIAAAILGHVGDLSYHTVLDAFGGTGAMAHAFKCAGKAVTYNDLLRFNEQIGLALIANDSVLLAEEDIASISSRRADVSYDDVIERHFSGIYFTDEENRWLDMAVANIGRLRGRFSRAIAWYALFQSAMAKRPYNLFHRSNLYMRTAKVSRSFGNKASWDRPFAEHFRSFAQAANQAVIHTGVPCRVLRKDALDVEPGYDLVYIDTPYISAAGIGVDYRDFYHFLEGMVGYSRWPSMIDHRSKHRRLLPQKDPWTDPRVCPDFFARLFERHRESILVVSYRSDGIPSIRELRGMLGSVKRRVRVVDVDCHQYALSHNRNSREILLIGLS